tara:strand:- start:3774 stop:4532 length:759 start_codon:yes stop_codon:yes gene_type:complete
MKNSRLDYKKYKIYLNSESHAEETIRLDSCKREPDTVKWIENLTSDSILYDIGANTGSYSLISASQKLIKKEIKSESFKNNKKISVVSIEPHPGNYISLIKNIYMNKFHELIMPLNIAVGKEDNIGFLNHWDGMPAKHPYKLIEAGSSGHQLNNTESEENRIFKPLAVQPIISLTLDMIVKLTNLIPTAIKIDVDGIEHEIIQGMKETLENDNLKTILIEVNKKEDQIKNILIKNDFKLTDICKHNNMIFER